MRDERGARRLQLKTQDARLITVTLRPQVINILVGNEQPSYSFDRAGRLFGGFLNERNYRRGLDNRVLEKWRDGMGRQRRWLSQGEARSFLEQAYTLAGEVTRAAGVEGMGLEALQGWDYAALEADAARFSQVYKPISILPPDQYLALVLQATEGCSYNRCTFCDFYRDRSFRIKGPEELRQHVAAVREFFGPAIGLRKSLFLADANALVAPMPRVRAWLDVIKDTGLLAGAGLYSFIDAFDVERKSAEEWRELAARGLRRVYIGLESGDDDLLRFLRKPGCGADAVAAVSRLKAAGVNASLIVMIGVGGDRYDEAHTAGTIAALGAMPLGPGDIVYFSPFVAAGHGAEYAALAEAAGIRSLDEAATARQEAALAAACTALWPNPQRGPRVAPYDIREFIY